MKTHIMNENESGRVLWLEAGKKRRLLDAACGNGSFLVQMMQFGWKVTGIEPDGGAVSIAREKLGLEVFQGSLDEAEFPEGHLDAITMNYVIEHVPNPIGLLQKCHRLLRPGGKLVVATPNIRSLGAHVFGEYWRSLEVPRHLFLFAPQALRACTKVAGLTILDLRTTAKIASSLIRRDGVLKDGLPERRVAYGCGWREWRFRRWSMGCVGVGRKARSW